MTLSHGERSPASVAVLVVFAAAIVAFVALGGTRYLTLDGAKEHADALRAFTAAHYGEALALSFGLYVLATTLSLPSGTVLSLTFGFLFGRCVATVLVVTAGTLGATILFLSVRYLFKEMLRRRLGHVGERINEEFTHDGFNWLLFLRLTPFFPYFLDRPRAALDRPRRPLRGRREFRAARVRRGDQSRSAPGGNALARDDAPGRATADIHQARPESLAGDEVAGELSLRDRQSRRPRSRGSHAPLRYDLRQPVLRTGAPAGPGESAGRSAALS